MFNYNSEQDKKNYITLKGLINKNDGFFKSPQHSKFVLRTAYELDESWVEALKEHFGITAEAGQYRLDVDATLVWSEHRGRSQIPFTQVFILDDYGILAQYKLHYRGNMKEGCAPNPEKTEVMWTRSKESPEWTFEDTVEKEPETKSDWVGEIKERIRDLKLSVVATPSYEHQSYAGYGMQTTYINIMEDNSKNCFVWKTSYPLNGEVVLDGTVKDHSEYNGKKQTVLTRCRVKG